MDSCTNYVQTRLAGPCLLCGQRSLGGLLCPPCRAELPELSQPVCPRCALPTADGSLCGRCQRQPPAFERTQAAFLYAPPLDILIPQLKYGGQLAVAPYLAAVLAARVVSANVDLLLPMPLHPHRLRERGFNQAVQLAAALGRSLQLPVDRRAARRLRPTPPQVGLSLRERQRNLKGVFTVEAQAVGGRRIALIDDVMTSGTSLDELAQACLKAGAASVEAWVVARAVRQF